MKTYVKPELFYENFELSQHIATCAWDMGNDKDVNSCAAISDENNGLGYPAGSVLFYAGPDICTDGTLDDYCYTNDEPGFNIFNS